MRRNYVNVRITLGLNYFRHKLLLYGIEPLKTKERIVFVK